MFNIFAFDLDGTLLNRDSDLSTYTLETIKLLAANQAHSIVFASGRHPIDMRLIAQSIPIDAHIVGANGAMVLDEQGKTVRLKTLSKVQMKSFIDFVSNSNVPMDIQCYTSNAWYLLPLDNESLVNYQQAHPSGFGCQYLPHQEALLALDDVIKIFLTCYDFAFLNQVLDAFKENAEIEIMFSTPSSLEMMPKDCDKLVGIQEVLVGQQQSLSSLMAFGDGFNDIQMLKHAGKGVLMGNAFDQVKEALPHLEQIGLHHEDGVAHFLNKQLDIPKIRS